MSSCNNSGKEKPTMGDLPRIQSSPASRTNARARTRERSPTFLPLRKPFCFFFGLLKMGRSGVESRGVLLISCLSSSSSNFTTSITAERRAEGRVTTAESRGRGRGRTTRQYSLDEASTRLKVTRLADQALIPLSIQIFSCPV